MTFDVFVHTLLARLGVPHVRADAASVIAEVDRLIRVSGLVDDLLADAGYDTLFDTREKGLEALRQDIKAKLKTVPPVDRETLAARLAEAAMPGMSGVLHRDFWLRAADTALRLIRPAPAIPPADLDMEAFAKLLFGCCDDIEGSTLPWERVGDGARSAWRVVAKTARHYLGIDDLRTTLAFRDHRIAEQRGEIARLTKDCETQKQMRLDLVAEQDKLVAALNEAQDQLAAERKKWPELKAEVERLKQQSIDLRFKIARLLGLGLTLPSAEALLKGLEARLKELTYRVPEVDVLRRDAVALRTSLSTCDQARHKAAEEVQRLEQANTALKAEVEWFKSELVAVRAARLWAPTLTPWLTSSQATVKPTRDRIRLALLDLAEPLRGTLALKLDEINALADHLVEKLKT